MEFKTAMSIVDYTTSGNSSDEFDPTAILKKTGKLKKGEEITDKNIICCI